jgi:SRSO17 transposase
MVDLDEGSDERMDEFIDFLVGKMRHAQWWGRKEVVGGYCQGLIMEGDRKSMEPMAARLDPLHTRAQYQAMQHLVTDSEWDHHTLVHGAREYALPGLLSHGPIEAWPLDDVSYIKQGKHSVGVARQYCGALGKTANCQVAVSVSLTNAVGSLPAAFRLYLPKAWVDSPELRDEVGIPACVQFMKKWEIALMLIDEMLRGKVPKAPILADAGYGEITEFREGLLARGLTYAVGINGTITVWPPGHGPVRPRCKGKRRGRPTRTLRRNKDHPALRVDALAQELAPDQWQEVTWREGTRGPMRGRFAAVRVIIAHHTHKRIDVPPEEWLLIEWPEGEPKPTKYWLSNLPASMELADLVRMAKLRWRIERDYEELKGEFGLDHFEGRTWRGFHHHASLCIATYAFVLSERARVFPPRLRDIIRSSGLALPRIRPQPGSAILHSPP